MDGKTILVTGGAKRVGAAICRRLHAAGANLVIHYHQSAPAARALQVELNTARPNSVMLIQADLLDCTSFPSIISTTVNHYGRLDALVNNASSFFATPIGSINEDNWLDLIGTNLKAPLFLAQAAAPELRRQRGCIINISDIHAQRPMKNYVVYSIAKAGLDGLTKSLARELGPEVRVNAIAPGPILWPEDAAQIDEVSRQRVISHTILKQAGNPDDIALAVYYLIANAPFMTGQVINVDGGRSVKL
ncbi:MAG: pteridine reductase [Sulfuriferula sp.]|nr:pteridine reductase [Sulfuriferula sp.]